MQNAELNPFFTPIFEFHLDLSVEAVLPDCVHFHFHIIFDINYFVKSMGEKFLSWFLMGKYTVFSLFWQIQKSKNSKIQLCTVNSDVP